MAKVTDLHGKPGADATKVELSEFKTANIATGPAPTVVTAGAVGENSAKEEPEEEPGFFESLFSSNDEEEEESDEPGFFDKLWESTKETAGDFKTAAEERVQADKAEGMAKDMFNNEELASTLKDTDFWKDVAKGDADLDALAETAGVKDLANAIKGEDCMKDDTSDLLKDIMKELLKRGWFNKDFFACLLQELKDMGMDFVNAVSENAQDILKDESMVALEGVGDVLEEEAKANLPAFKEGLKSYAGVGEDDPEGEGNFLNDVMCKFDPDWAKTDNGDVDLDTFDSASPEAKKGLSTVEDDDIFMGLSISGLFEDATSAGKSAISDAPTYAI